MIPQPLSFADALAQPYRAAMFDIDGTLTEMGESHVPQPLRHKLCEVSRAVPVAFCSGRKFDGILGKLEEILAEVSPAERPALRRNWYFFLENGAIGVRYNAKEEQHERFYTFEWPESLIPIMEMQSLVAREVSSLARAEVRRNEFNVGIYPEKALAEITAVIASHLKLYLKTRSDWGIFHVVDSGVAVHVMPKFPDKDYGIVRFAEVLREERGVTFSPEIREILVVGDQPGPGFNDERFLNGKNGTPFTVGRRLAGAFPLSVEREGVPLNGPEGTLHLLNAIKLAP